MSAKLSSPKVALVYDRVNTPYGGAENVLLSLHKIFPDAPLFTSVYDESEAQWAKGFDVRPSFLQTWPSAPQNHRNYVGLMPIAFESLNLDEFDIVISITSAEAKGIITKPHQLHICYLLTPTRYLWSHADEYQQGVLVELIKKPLFNYLRWWESAASKRPDVYIPISKLVAERCQNYYHRQTEAVIYPPVQLEIEGEDSPDSSLPLPTLLTELGVKKNEYFLVVARLVGYKRIDLAIKSCAELNKTLVIIGNGPELSTLEDLVRMIYPQAKIIFVHAVQSRDLAAYYKNCLAFVAPGEEDFGIAALESHLFGKPAILNHKSGGAEISPDGVSSTHITEQTVIAVKNAIIQLEKTAWNAAIIKKQLEKHNAETFEKEFSATVKKLWTTYCKEMNLV